MGTHGTLETWRALIEVGGYARVAEKLHERQSAVAYAVQNLLVTKFSITIAR